MAVQVMQHLPFIGRNYANTSPRIVVMGYSHHGNVLNDDEMKTRDVVNGVIAGDHPPTQFFYHLSSYFGDQGDAFWDNVAFFNFAPRVVGGSEQKHDEISPADLIEARERFGTLLEELQPDMVMVFSRKGWRNLPSTQEDEQETGGDLILTGEQFDRHHYRLASGKTVQAFGLRHPERATKSVMMNAVTAAMTMKPHPPIA